MAESFHRSEIREAWKKGKRKITLDGTSFKLSLVSSEAVWQVGPANARETRTQIEKWLVATPADGSLLPIISIEYEAGMNVRSK